MARPSSTFRKSIRGLIGTATLLAGLIFAPQAFACTNPAATAGDIIYNGDVNKMTYCDGTNWISMGDGTDASSSAVAPTTGLVGHWTLDESSGTSVADSSGSGNTGTSNDATPTWTAGRLNGALDVDSDEVIDVGTWDVSGTGLTLSGWFFLESSVNDPRLICKTSGFNASDADWCLFIDNSDDIGLRLTTAGGFEENLTAVDYFSNYGNAWHHITVTYNSGTGGIAYYIDGALVDTDTHSLGGAVTTGTGETIGLGNNPSAIGLRPFDGLMDDLRVYDRPLSSTEVLNLFYATNGSANDNLLGHWKLDETTGSTITDSGSGGNNGTWSDGSGNSVAEETTTAKLGTAITFDGVDDKVTFPSTVTDGLSQFTAAMWIRTTESGTSGTYTSRPAFFGNETCCDASNDIVLQTDAGNIAYFHGLDSTDRIFVSSTPINDDQWHHVAVTYNGGQTDLYVDGTLVPGSTLSADGSVLNTAGSAIGDWTTVSAARPHEGTLDDFRIYNRALSASEIGALSAACEEGSMVYNAGHSVPQYCAGNDNWVAMGPINDITTNLIHHWTLDETSGSTIFDSGSLSQNGTWDDSVNNDVAEETTAGKVGTALDFDGTDDEISVSNFDVPQTGSVSFWVNFDSTSGTQRMFGSDDDFELIIFSGNFDLDIHGASPPISPVTAGKWHHVVSTFDVPNNTQSFYLNGTLIGTATTPSPVTGTQTLTIGTRAGNEVDGQMDDVRVYSRPLSHAEVADLYTLGQGGSMNTIVFEDYEGGATGWSDNTTDATETGNFTEFLGRFGDSNGVQAVSKTFTLPATQTEADIEFNLYKIDTPDNEPLSVFIDDILYTDILLGNTDVPPETSLAPTLTEFLGRFGDSNGAQVVSKSYTLSGTQTEVTLNFDIYSIDSWDVSDTIDVFINDTVAFSFAPRDTHATSGSFTNGSYTISNTIDNVQLGFGIVSGSWVDSVDGVSITFTTSATSIKLGLGADTDESLWNENWGIDNVNITSNAGGSTTITDENFETVKAGWTTPTAANTLLTNIVIETINTGALGFGAGAPVWDDTIYKVSFPVDTTSASLKLGFGFDTDESLANESYGIDNLRIDVDISYSCTNPVGKEGDLIFNDDTGVDALTYCDGANWQMIGKSN